MLKFQTRMLVASYVLSDVLATAVAWLLAYALRFHALDFVLPVTKGVPPLADYLVLVPLMAALWPAVMYFHGLYRPRRGRSRIDELFAIVFSVLIASALTLGATLYVRVYYRYQPEVSPRWEYSQAVFALFVLLDVVLLAAGRSAIRESRERQWAAGQDAARVVIAGTGELGRTVADALLAHRELGYRVVGFLAESEPAQGYAGPAGARAARDREGDARGAPLRPALRGAAPGAARPHRAAREAAQQRVRRHQGRAGRDPVRDDQGDARGPRRPADHQPQRGAAAGLEQHGQAADGHRRLGRAAGAAGRGARAARDRAARSCCAAAGAPSCCARSA